MADVLTASGQRAAMPFAGAATPRCSITFIKAFIILPPTLTRARHRAIFHSSSTNSLLPRLLIYGRHYGRLLTGIAYAMIVRFDRAIISPHDVLLRTPRPFSIITMTLRARGRARGSRSGHHAR